MRRIGRPLLPWCRDDAVTDVADEGPGTTPAGSEPVPAESDPVDVLLDAVLYGPLGLLLSVRRLWPDLVETGRREADAQLRTAQVVGRVVVHLARNQGGRLLRDYLSPQAPPVPEPEPETPETSESASAASGTGRAPRRTRSAAGGRTAPGGAEGKRGSGRRPVPTPPVPDRSTPAPAESDSADRPEAAAGTASTDSSHTASAALAIEGYDTLPASLVVPRLGGLSRSELEAIRAHETATRRRRTILSRIAQLEAERAAGPTP